MIRAILRAQWLSLRTFRGRGGVVSLVVGIIWYGFWLGVSTLVERYTSNPDMHDEIIVAAPAGLMIVFLYWQLSPLFSASMGASLDLRKLLVYPIPHHKVFLIEILLRLTTCVEMLLVVAAGAIGILENTSFGAWRAAPFVLTGTLGFVLFNLLLSAGVRTVIERLLSHKRIREILILILVLITAVPRLLIATGVRVRAMQLVDVVGRQVAWPWVGTASLALNLYPIAGAISLSLWILFAYSFGRWQFERSLRFDARAAEATTAREASRRSSAWSERAFRLPSLVLPDPVAAVVEKELRSLMRTPRFRLVFIMGFSFGLLVWLPLIIGKRSAVHSPVGENFLVIVGAYALTLLGQVSYWNTFGFDRSATQVYYSAPVSMTQTLVGKNVAAALFIFLEIAVVTLACLLLRVPLPPAKIGETFLVISVSALYLLAIGNLSSVHYPRAMNPERVSQGGAAQRFQALIFVFYPLALIPVFLAYLARYAFDSQMAFLIILAVAAVVGAIVYWIAMESAVVTAQKRREQILAELSRGEGPVVTD